MTETTFKNFTIMVPAGYMTWFAQGEPQVAKFEFQTQVQITSQWTGHWVAATKVDGFPPERMILFSQMDFADGTLQVIA